MTQHSRPTLTRKARLRFDRISGEYLLLSPERGLILNGPASEILRLCTGVDNQDGKRFYERNGLELRAVAYKRWVK